MLRYVLLLVPFLLLNAPTAWAQEAWEQVVPPRVSLLDGRVSFWRPGMANWTPATANIPLASGDALAAEPGANLEIQIAAQAWLRAGDAARMQLGPVELATFQVRLFDGMLSLDLRYLPPGSRIVVALPVGTVTVARKGYYRFHVEEGSVSVVTRRGAAASLALPGQGSLAINAAEEVVLGAGGGQTYVAPELDTWDQWNYSRSEYLLDSISARYVPGEVYGVADLDHYGTWRTMPEYGPVWFPSAMPANWVPYGAGYWLSDPVFGWTWVDNSPWGYAPFHYGRWIQLGGGWAWAPGPRGARPVYAPALVGWFDAGNGGVAWVALGWGEPLLPWWGARDFAGRPWWGGWEGPKVVNRTVHPERDRLAGVRAADISYANRHNGVLIAHGEHFAGRGQAFARPSGTETRSWQPSERGPAVRPVLAAQAGEHAPAGNTPEDGSRTHAQSPRSAVSGLPPIPPGQARMAMPDRREVALPSSPKPDTAGSRPSASAASAALAGPAPQAVAPVQRVRPSPPPGFSDWSRQRHDTGENPARGVPGDTARPAASPVAPVQLPGTAPVVAPSPVRGASVAAPVPTHPTPLPASLPSRVQVPAPPHAVPVVAPVPAHGTVPPAHGASPADLPGEPAMNLRPRSEGGTGHGRERQHQD